MPLNILKGWSRWVIGPASAVCGQCWLRYPCVNTLSAKVGPTDRQKDSPIVRHRSYTRIIKLTQIHCTKRIQAKSRLNPSLIYRFRRLLTIPLIGLVILMLDMELAMAGSARRGSSSAAAPLAGPRTPAAPPAPVTRFSGALRSRRRQLTQIPIK